MTEPATAPYNTVTWWELPVTDISAAQAFYRSVFGWEYQSFGDDERYAGILSEGVLVGGLFLAETDTPLEPSVRVYVNVPDLEAALDAAEAHGGAVRQPRTEVGGDMGWWAELTDPDGRWVGLCTDQPARADAAR